MESSQYPDTKVHGVNVGPVWGRQDPGGPHVGPMNLAIWVSMHYITALVPQCGHWWPVQFIMYDIAAMTLDTIAFGDYRVTSMNLLSQYDF